MWKKFHFWPCKFSYLIIWRRKHNVKRYNNIFIWSQMHHFMIKYNQSALNNKSECFLLKQMIKTLRLNQGYKNK